MNSNVKGYYPYLDTVKGVAIVLVVMGHALSWLFDDWHIIGTHSPSPSYLWYFIYKFHMPLFIMVSGILFYREDKEYKGRAFLKNLLHKSRFLLPYFLVGPLLRLARGEGVWFDYWYLWVLFECIVINSIWELLRPKFKYSILTDALFYISIYVIINYLATSDSISPIIKNVFELDFLRYYLYFAIGIILHRYHLLEIVVKKNWCFSLCLLFYLFFFFGRELGVVPPSYYILLVARAAMSFVVLYLCHNVFTMGKCVELLQLCGRKSLEIYIIHFFFVFKFPEIGEYCIKMVDTRGGFGMLTNMSLQLVWALGISVIVISLSLLVAKIIGSSQYLSPLLLGRKAKLPHVE